MEDYKSNARPELKADIPEKKVEKVISGSVRSKKKSGLEKAVSWLIPEDVGNVKTYIFFDVLIPLVKTAVYETVGTLLYPNGGGRRKGSSANRVSYREYYDRGSDRRDYGGRALGSDARSSYGYDDLIFDTRGDAEEVLYQLDSLLSRYHIVSVADLYDLSGKTGGSYTDNRYGWTDLRTARVERVREGFVIRLPRALPLD